MVYEKVARPVLFRLAGGDAERVHSRTLGWLASASRNPLILKALRGYYKAPAEAARTCFGVRFPNPVGLAAGLDKNGVALPAWPALGFGFVEVGTVTRYAQPGNDRPRLFRYPASEAIVNRMGFNNDGAEALARRLAMLGKLGVPLGISLGKSKVTPVEEAVDDYVSSLRTLHSYADYVAINVSSPNTPGLRTLQGRAELDDLLDALTAEATSLAGAGKPVPLLVKVAPDLTDDALGELLEVCAARGVAGIIATNTTLSRDGLAADDVIGATAEPGGLSGRPLRQAAERVVRFVSEESGGTLPVVGVGGILTPDDARRLFDAGASLVQLYTGFIYRGPRLIRQITRSIPSTVKEGSAR